MDFRHLEEDELGVELVIRQIDRVSASAFDRLISVSNMESAGQREKPSLPHPVKTSTEVVLCKRKLSQLDKDRRSSAISGDQVSLNVLRSRALHLIDRLERLHNHARDNHAIPPPFSKMHEIYMCC